jgi:hypothetical protein
MLTFVGSVVIYVMLCSVHASSKFAYPRARYVDNGLYIFLAAFPFCLRACLHAPKVKMLNVFMDIFDTLSPIPFLMSLFQLVASVVGCAYPFVFTFLLMDAGNMSKSLQLCFKAIFIPFKQLLLTIMFFIIVIAVYTAIAFEVFGVPGYNPSSENLISCNSLFDCFVLTTYITFR